MTETTAEARRRVYLAGPEVFLADPLTIGRRKQEICARYDLIGEYPMDNAIDPTGLEAREAGLRISQANEALMQRCGLMIANMTPFRGPSADVGTAYEMGFMRSRGCLVLAYSNVVEPYVDRMLAVSGTRRLERGWVDAHDMTVEDHGLTDNLMLDGGVVASGGRVIVHATDPESRYTDLTAFEECVRLAGERL